MDKKKKILLIIVSSLLVVALGITFAFYAPEIGLGSKTNIDIEADGVDTLTFVNGDAISLRISQNTLTEGGANLTSSSTSKASLKANTTNNTASGTYNVYVSIPINTFVYTSGTTAEILLKITDPTGTEITSSTLDGLTRVTSGGATGYDITTKEGLITVAEDYAIAVNNSPSATVQSWKIDLYFINLTTDQINNVNKSMSAKIILQKEKYITLVNKLASDVPSIYNNVYQVVSDENGNYRYSGSYNSVNNWVCFGSTEATYPDNNLYRIIGVFNIDGSYKYKLIQGDYATTAETGTPSSTGSRSTSDPGHTSQTTINVYKWHTANGVTWGSGTTCASSLCTLLNGTYLTNIGTTWSNLIATSTWYAYTNTSAHNISASVLYSGEIASTTYTGKVGLMSLSDYAYGATSTYWSSSLNTNSSNRILNDWMYNGGYFEWTISQYNTSRAWSVTPFGIAHKYDNLNYGNAVRPVLYLASDVYFSSGTGERSTPYRITIS